MLFRSARIAILDPELTVSQPTRVTSVTGVDAIAHALESAVTTRRSALSWTYSQHAFVLCAGSLPLVLASPQNLEWRGRMLLGAALAGLAIENSMLGAAHADGYPFARKGERVTALDRYVAKPDDHYKWELVKTEKEPGLTSYTIDMTSQQWRTEKEVDRPIWKH